MRKMLLFGLMAAGLVASSAAQSAPLASNAGSQGTASAPDSSTPLQPGSNPWPAGMIIPAELAKSLDAKKAKVGDQIEAKVPADQLSHGKIVIPRNTKIIGHVTGVKAHSKESPDSRVGIAFDRMVMKDGRDLPLQVVVQAVGRPLRVADLPGGRMNQGVGLPGGSASIGGGSGMGASMPPRSTERVASIPTDVPAVPDPESPAATVAPLGPTSQGVVGIKGFSLEISGPNSVISSQTENVHLDGGTQLILRMQ
jgi:hypothetical protein